MNSFELRKSFLEFFKSKDHPVVPSSPLVAYGDNSLLFTTAGMVQFKPYFLGLKDDLKRACSCQKCFRTTDIDNVGKTIRHLTFFEMLGNFSFGDYFKEESLKWGYEFLVNVLGLNPSRLYFSVYKGGVSPRDEETIEIWKKILPPDLHSHIFEAGEDNFWSMGETGPSGPSSEIYYDRGEMFAHSGCKGPSCGCDRYIEIWNHVFTQFDRQKDGSFKPLAKKNIDTGMGLERICFITENKFSPFETSLFFPIIKLFISNNHNFLTDENKKMADIVLSEEGPEAYYRKLDELKAFESFLPALRVISDHIRGASFLISEGVLPSNEGRGYVVRRLIRRAVRYSLLCGVKEPSIYKLVDAVEGIFKNVYHQIGENKDYIKNVIKYEEEGFLKTIEEGERYIENLLNSGTITGYDAFKIYETYGFPYELIKEIAEKKKITIDDKEFREAKNRAQDISRKWKKNEDILIFHKVNSKFSNTEFVGYDSYSSQSRLIGIVDEKAVEYKEVEGGIFYLVFDRTPFYAEGGGQVGDRGFIFKDGNIVAEIIDTQKPFDNVFYHKAIIRSRISTGNSYELKIDIIRRKKISANHTATHLLNAALKKVFGPNTLQAGSLVSDEKFRFDYTINKTPSIEEIMQVEKIVNDAIMQGYRVFKETRPLSDAKKLGAVMLVGEHYTDPARFVLINHLGFDEPQRYSLELCGGTHVDDLKEVFRVKIFKDTSLSRGIRRIEASSGYSLLEWYERRNIIVEELLLKFGCSEEEIKGRINKLEKEIKELKDKLNNFKEKEVEDEVVELKNGKRLVFVKISNSDVRIIRNLADKKKSSFPSSFVFVYSINPGEKKISFVFTRSKDNPISLKEIFANLNIEGFKGGGREDFIQGGGVIENEVEFKNKIISILS